MFGIIFIYLQELNTATMKPGAHAYNRIDKKRGNEGVKRIGKTKKN